MARAGQTGWQVDGGQGRLRGPFTTRSPPFHLHRAAAGGAMDLAGLLLDEEGTFSLTGFQDFSVSGRLAPPRPPLTGSRDPGRSPPGPRARLTVCPGAERQPLEPCLLEALAGRALG